MTALELKERIADTRRGVGHGLRAFYSRPLGWGALAVTSVLLSYGGGGVMYWFHAIYRGEAGPPIPHSAHWLFDSTLGFLALTPALFFILPAALWALGRTGIRRPWLRSAVYVAAVGVAFGVVTGPGPLLHNALVGRETFLGRLAVSVFGTDPSVAARHVEGHSAASEVLLQIAVGLPVYTAAALLALLVVRTVARRSSG